MPSYRDGGNRDFTRFDTMTDEALEEILRLDANSPEGGESDVEMLLYVMEVLARRRRNDGTITKTPEEALKSFQENYLPCNDEDLKVVSGAAKARKGFRRALVGVAAAFAIVIFGSVTASAFGFDLWDIFVRWTQETFNFSNSVQESVPAPERENYNIDESLVEQLGIFNISKEVVPTWIPDGYELEDVIVDETPLRKEVLAVYLRDEDLMKFSVIANVGGDPEQIEKSDTSYESYESQGCTYYIFSDNEFLYAVWNTDQYECYISGMLTIEEIKTMIDSIEKG